MHWIILTIFQKVYVLSINVCMPHCESKICNKFSRKFYTLQSWYYLSIKYTRDFLLSIYAMRGVGHSLQNCVRERFWNHCDFNDFSKFEIHFYPWFLCAKWGAKTNYISNLSHLCVIRLSIKFQKWQTGFCLGGKLETIDLGNKFWQGPTSVTVIHVSWPH